LLQPAALLLKIAGGNGRRNCHEEGKAKCAIGRQSKIVGQTDGQEKSRKENCQESCQENCQESFQESRQKDTSEKCTQGRTQKKMASSGPAGSLAGFF
jgi:hypothetical protein